MSRPRGPRQRAPGTLSPWAQRVRVHHKFFAMFCAREGIDPMRATPDDIRRFIAEKVVDPGDER